MTQTSRVLKQFLIVGGSSGLGLALATMYRDLGHTVHIAGRKDPGVDGLIFHDFAIGDDVRELATQADRLVAEIEKANTLVYAAGFYQEGRIDALTDTEIATMIHVGLTAPALLVRRLKRNPGRPLKVMLVTSSSQYTPRELEPVYTAVKAGLGMLGESLSLDPELGKVVVIAPSGMQTPFWNGQAKDTTDYLDPHWVAQQIADLSGGPFKYRFAKILRGPARVEIAETRTE